MLLQQSRWVQFLSSYYDYFISIVEGVGVDIRVNHAVVFGLSETPESLLQEGGRPMRGSLNETQNKQGFAFFFHKGNLGKSHISYDSHL